LFAEIDGKKSEHAQLDAKVHMTVEATAIITEQNRMHLAVLDDYHHKIVEQTTLADKLRGERNDFKRQAEDAHEEYIELKTQCDQVEAEIRTLEKKSVDILISTVDLHTKNMGMAEHKKTLIAITGGQQQGILDAERTISRLQAEYQTLSHILTEAQHDHLQMQKEHQVVENNLQVIRDDLRHKCKTIEHVRSEIFIQQTWIMKSGRQFKEKTLEILSMVKELLDYEARTRELEEAREKMLTLDYHKQRLVSEHMFEQRKCLALIYEFSVLRNVHRWDLIAAVDQTYAKQLWYRAQLTGKIDAAHREGIELRAERDRLKAKLAIEMQRPSRMLSTAEVAERIEAYSEDLREKESQLKELRMLVSRNDPLMHNSIKSVSEIHVKVTDRRGNIARLRTASVASRKAPEPWFLTEGLQSTVYGGGFVVPPLEAERAENTDLSNTDMKVKPRAKTSLDTTQAKRLKSIIGVVRVKSPKRVPLPALA
jgi:predicted  nucleic acid-binding Zn-ribbon protein